MKVSLSTSHSFFELMEQLKDVPKVFQHYTRMGLRRQYKVCKLSASHIASLLTSIINVCQLLYTPSSFSSFSIFVLFAWNIRVVNPSWYSSSYCSVISLDTTSKEPWVIFGCSERTDWSNDTWAQRPSMVQSGADSPCSTAQDHSFT